MTQVPAPQPAVTLLYTAQGAPIQVINVNTSDGTCHSYNAPAARILGALQISLGFLIILTQVVLTALRAEVYQGYVGFWAGALFVIAGSFGVQSSKSKSTCSVVTTMVMSIIGACLSAGVISQGGLGAYFASFIYDCNYDYDTYYDVYPQYERHCSNEWTPYASVAIYSIMVILGIVEGIVAIVAAAYCCHGCCNHSRPGLVLSPAGMTQIPMVPGGMQIATVQHNPGAYYPAPLANINPATYSEGTTPPPEYKEKV